MGTNFGQSGSKILAQILVEKKWWITNGCLLACLVSDHVANPFTKVEGMLGEQGWGTSVPQGGDCAGAGSFGGSTEGMKTSLLM